MTPATIAARIYDVFSNKQTTIVLRIEFVALTLSFVDGLGFDKQFPDHLFKMFDQIACIADVLIGIEDHSHE